VIIKFGKFFNTSVQRLLSLRLTSRDVNTHREILLTKAVYVCEAGLPCQV